MPNPDRFGKYLPKTLSLMTAYCIHNILATTRSRSSLTGQSVCQHAGIKYRYIQISGIIVILRITLYCPLVYNIGEVAI
jgi:hypothetical protein